MGQARLASMQQVMENGGGILDDGASPALLGILVKNNQAESRGAGIFKNTGATLRISNSIIAGNFGTEGYQCNGAGIGGDGGEGSLFTDVRLKIITQLMREVAYIFQIILS